MCTVLSKSGERAEVFNFFLSLSPFMYNHDQFLSFQSNHFTSDFDLTVDQGAADKPSENELEVRSGVKQGLSQRVNLRTCNILPLGQFVLKIPWLGHECPPRSKLFCCV